MELPQIIIQQLYRCSRCGACLEKCPSYLATGNESLSARGRASLILAALEGRLEPGLPLKERLSRCLGCLSCAGACPSGVNLPQIINLVKEKLAASDRERWLPVLAMHGLDSKGATSQGIRAAASVCAAISKAGRAAMGPAPWLDRMPLLPPASRRPLKKLLSEHSPAKKAVMRIAFFPGCSTRLFFPETAVCAVHILNLAGAEVVTSHSLRCCGQPLAGAGRQEKARQLAAENAEILKGLKAEAIVTACPSCAIGLKEQLQGSPALDGSPARQIAAGVWDIHQVISQENPLFDVLHINDSLTVSASGAPRQAEPALTWHEPCHFRYGLKSNFQPREFFGRWPGVRYIDPGEQSCCGGGGLFSLRHPDVARQIGMQRSAELALAGGKTVVTACPSCRIHLSEMFLRLGRRVQVIHTVELMAG